MLVIASVLLKHVEFENWCNDKNSVWICYVLLIDMTQNE